VRHEAATPSSLLDMYQHFTEGYAEMLIPVYQTTQCYIQQDCFSGWKQSGTESILTEGENVQKCIIKSSVISVQNQLPS